jgi:hypothetical protein
MAALLGEQRGWSAMIDAAKRRDRFTAGRLLRQWLTPGAGAFVIKQLALSAAETFLSFTAAELDPPPPMRAGIAGAQVEDAAHEMLTAAIAVVIDPTIERRAVTLDRASRRYAAVDGLPALIGGHLLGYIGDMYGALAEQREKGDAPAK